MYKHIEVGDKIRSRYNKKHGVVTKLHPWEVDGGASCWLQFETESGEEFIVHEYFAIIE